MLLLAAVIAAASCATSKKDVAHARSSVYDADFAVVYSAALAAVRDKYPTSDEDPVKGTIRTAWHQVAASRPGEDPTQVVARDPSGVTGSGGGFTGATGTALERTFVRFDVSVLGGRPWRVKVVGRASKWEPGNAVPVELRGADAPAWLEGRTDSLVVAIHERLASYAKAAPTSDTPIEAEAPIDLATFGPIPTPAATAVAAVRKALAARDMTALRAAVASDVTWSFGASPGVDGAMAIWQADPVALEKMAEVLDAGCRAGGDALVSCPPAATEQPGYTGWRATFEPRGSRWTMTAFVQGD